MCYIVDVSRILYILSLNGGLHMSRKRRGGTAALVLCGIIVVTLGFSSGYLAAKYKNDKLEKVSAAATTDAKSGETAKPAEQPKQTTQQSSTQTKTTTTAPAKTTQPAKQTQTTTKSQTTTSKTTTTQKTN
jgi:hypothetical protein